MTLETFFEKFALFAEAPDAVGKMRALAVNFAARGPLLSGASSYLTVPSDQADPTDQSALATPSAQPKQP